MNKQKLFCNFRASFGLLAIFTVLLGGVYPLVASVFAKIIPHNSEELLGKNWTDNKYFWGRLSANNYDVMNSGGTNFSPSNHKLLDAANLRIAALQKAEPDNKQKIPVDLITASASGLDPHISISAAKYQIGRVAAARKITVEEVKAIVENNISAQSKMFGEPYVNVLELNQALDKVGLDK
jgi:K+-transporting ATPase ATPase C chain